MSGRSIPDILEKGKARNWTSVVAQTLKNPPAMWETQVWSLGWEDPLEEEMAIHSSILAWRIPWTEEPGGLQSRGSQRVGHDLATKRSTADQGLSCRPLFELYSWLQNWHLWVWHLACWCVPVSIYWGSRPSGSWLIRYLGPVWF